MVSKAIKILTRWIFKNSLIINFSDLIWSKTKKRTYFTFTLTVLFLYVNSRSVWNITQWNTWHNYNYLYIFKYFYIEKFILEKTVIVIVKQKHWYITHFFIPQNKCFKFKGNWFVLKRCSFNIYNKMKLKRISHKIFYLSK